MPTIISSHSDLTTINQTLGIAVFTSGNRRQWALRKHCGDRTDSQLTNVGQNREIPMLCAGPRLNTFVFLTVAVLPQTCAHTSPICGSESSCLHTTFRGLKR